MNHLDPSVRGGGTSSSPTRRTFLKTSSSVAAASAILPSWLPAVRPGRPGLQGNTLIQVYLRGGMDGLSAVIPQFDGLYSSKRGTLALPPAADNLPESSIVLPGTGGFELHPACSLLLDPFEDDHLTFVHCTGIAYDTLSHFDAQRIMETGVGTSTSSVTSGWITRHLDQVPDRDPSFPMRAISITQAIVRSLAEASQTFADPKPGASGFFGNPTTAKDRRLALEAMFQVETPPVSTATLTAFEVVDILDAIDFAGYASAGATPYPNHPFGMQMKACAAMLVANLPLEAMALDFGGWDDHNNIGVFSGGAFHERIGALAQGLRAFYDDMVARGMMNGVLVHVMSEFGRRIQKNASEGLDHGRGGVSMLMSGAIQNARVVFGAPSQTWPGLASENLALQVDCRDVMYEVLFRFLGNVAAVNALFPGHTWTDLGLLT